jgi:acetolactate synthase regulatory subunit
MSYSLFIKMSRAEGALEKLLERVRERDCHVVEMTAKCSLDNAFFFIRMFIDGSGSADTLRYELSSLDEVQQLDIEQTSLGHSAAAA